MKFLKEIFSYCHFCLIARYFILINGTWVCEKCGNPLIKAKDYGTIVTSVVQEQS